MKSPEVQYRTPLQPHERVISVYNETEVRRAVKELVEVVEDEQIDSLVFLDVSTRPIARIFGRVMRGRENGGHPTPDRSFVKIGRELRNDDPLRDDKPEAINAYLELTKALDTARRAALIHDQLFRKTIDEASIEAISEMVEFTRDPVFLQFVEQARATFKDKFQGKRVLIVDDFLGSGTSLAYAAAVFQHAFPDVEVLMGCWLDAPIASHFKRGIGVRENDAEAVARVEKYIGGRRHSADLFATAVGAAEHKQSLSSRLIEYIDQHPEIIESLEQLPSRLEALEEFADEYEGFIQDLRQAHEQAKSERHDLIAKKLNIIDRRGRRKMMNSMREAISAVREIAELEDRSTSYIDLCRHFAALSSAVMAVYKDMRTIRDLPRVLFSNEIYGFESRHKSASNFLSPEHGIFIARIADIAEEYTDDGIMSNNRRMVNRHLRHIADTICD